MRIRFVVNLGRSAGTVVVLDCAAGTRLTAVWTILTEAAGVPGASLEGVSADGESVTPASTIGLPPLLDGAALERVETPARRFSAPVELRVVSGPDAGGRYPLTGRHVVGRSSTADITIRDPALSRRHVALDIREGAVWLTDLGSANGTALIGRTVRAGSQRLRVGPPFRLGDTTLALRTTPRRPAAVAPQSRTRTVTPGSARAARLPLAAPVIRIPPEPVTPSRWSMASLVVGLPAVASVVTGFAMGSPMLAVVGAGACLAWGLQSLLTGRTSRLQQTEQRQRHKAERAAVAGRVRAAVHRERSWRDRMLPDLATVVDVAVTRGPMLWDRAVDDEEGLAVRLGTGTELSTTTVATDQGDSWHPTMPDCPVGITLDDGPTEMVGADREQVVSCARSLILQLLTRHPPNDLTLCVAVAREECLPEWEWLRWPAHTRPGGRFETMVVPAARAQRVVRYLETLAALHENSDGASLRAPRTLVVIDGPVPVDDSAGFGSLLRRSAAGIHVLRLLVGGSDVSEESRQQVRLSPEGGVVVKPTGETSSFRPDGLGRELAAAAGRSLARQGQAVALKQPVLPNTVSLVDVVGLPHVPAGATPLAEEEAWAAWLMDSWRRPCEGLPMSIGVTATGPMVVDLCADGPHALIAGTTGSGKSELLRAVVASLAAANPPTNLAFVLIDFKGGAAFAECERLPHTTGLLTDFEGDQTVRALGGLRAELARREALLRAAGVDDLRHLPSRTMESEQVPRLMIVVDEFRALAEDRPEVLADLIRIASQGRSLGVHLVLATQRPAGIVSGDIRANAALRIALRVTDRAESFDVLGSDDAARLPPAVPGRAVVRCSDGQTTEVQVGRIGGRAGIRPETATAVALPWPEPDEVDVVPDTARPHTDLERLVSAARTAATRLGLPAVRSPWAAPLPAMVTVNEIRHSHRESAADSDPETTCGSPGGSLLLGLMEDLEAQALHPLHWHPTRSGHLAVCGGPGSGRGTLLRAVLHGVGEMWCPARLEAYVLDPAGTLAELASQTRVLGYAGPGDRAMARRIVERLVDRVEEPSSDTPAALLVVHGWESLVSLASGLDLGRLEEDLTSLLRAREDAGVRLVVTGSRVPLLPPLAALFANRVALGGLDAGDMLLAGLPHRNRAPRVPGRGWHLPTGHACQVALPSPPSTEADIDHGERASRLGETDRRPCCPASSRLRPLPCAIRLTELPDAGRSGSEPLKVPIGVTQEGTTALLDLAIGGVLVAGPRRSGRTTAIVAIATALAGVREVVVLTGDPRRSPDGLPESVILLGPLHAGELMEVVSRNPQVALLCDDAEAFEDTVLETVLLDHAGRAGLDRGPCVLTTTTVHAAGSYRGAIGLLRRNGRGLLLNPGRREDEVFTRPLGCLEPRRPGLAVLVEEESQQVVQLALPGSAESQACLAPIITAPAPTTALARTRPPMIG